MERRLVVGPRRALAVGLRVEPKPALTSLSVLRSSTGLMLSRLARQSLALHPPELELPLQVGHIDVRHFTRANELIEIGSHAIDEAMPAIRALAEASD